MLQNKTIAVFIDVDNCSLSFDNYKNALDQINDMGNVVSCKLYGVSDRRHREIIADANDNGYDMAFAMRIKKRNTRVFDNRILVDIVEKVVTNPQIDAVAVVCAPTDMVYLYRFLKKREVFVIALDNTDEDSVKLVDEVLDLGQVQTLKFPAQKPLKTVDDVLEEAVAQPQMTAEEKNAKLQDEIERLRQENGIVLPEQPVEEPQEQIVEEQESAEEVVVEASEQLQEELPAVEESETLSGQAQSLLDEIAKLRAEEYEQPAEQVVEEIVVEETLEDPQEELPAVEESLQEVSGESIVEEATEPVLEAPAEDSAEDQLISQIESLRANLTDDSNDEELIAQIKFLLDGLE